VLAKGHKIVCVIPQDEIVLEIANEMGLDTIDVELLNEKQSQKYFSKLEPDLFVCAHGRKIVNNSILSIPKHGGINVHPCLYKYKGAKPIERLLSDKETKASVGVHRMINEVDTGEVLEEIFVDVEDCNEVLEVYNKLYPYYSIALSRVLDKL
jgi:methionyl-tRNA formyltransferase